MDNKNNTNDEAPLEEQNFCYYDGKKYSEGSEVCQAGEKFSCEMGEWMPTGVKC